jgi:hypothetical protein
VTRNFTALLLAGALLWTAGGCSDCRGSAKEGDAPAAPAGRSDAGLGAESRFGIDYVFPFVARYRDEALARTMASTGAGWVNFAEVRWGAVEPKPPEEGTHDYRWDELDEAVSIWQRQGFRLVFTLRMGKGWFAGPIKHDPEVMPPLLALMLSHSDRLPAPEHDRAYDAWIAALVERYDGDGNADMPGLANPVLHYQVGNEYANPAFWTGTLSDYGELLERTARAVASACSEAKVISNGIRWNDLFHGDPEAKRFEERFDAFVEALPSDEWRREWKRARAFTEGTVALAKHFHILDAGGNGPYPTATAGYLAWVRRELAKTEAKPAIWDLESRCEPLLVHEPTLTFHRSLAVPDGATLLKRLKTPLHRDHDRVEAWYRAEQARSLVQVFVARFAAGAEKVFMGMPDDWDKSPAAWGAPNPFLGLVDRKGQPWPALAALRTLVAELDGFVTAAPVAAPEGVELFRFTFPPPRTPTWVAWLRVEAPYGLDDPLPRRKVVLDAIRGPATVRPVPTKAEPALPTTLPSGQPLQLDLAPTPVTITSPSPG